MSDDQFAEYSSVLRRPKFSRLHGRTSDALNQILVDLVANAMWCVPVYGDVAPDIGDSHLWALLAVHPQGLLVTGDRLLIDNPPSGASVSSPRRFADTFLPSDRA